MKNHQVHSPIADVESQPEKMWAQRAPLPLPPPPPQEMWFTWLIPCFAFANTLTFVYSMYVNDCPSNHPLDSSSCTFFPLLRRLAFEPYADNKLLGPSISTLDRLGALDSTKVAGGERWRLISCIWLHAGVFHLLPNMSSLLFVGVRLEQEFGFVKIGALYVLSGFGGSLMSSLSIKRKMSVGASGAVFGLLGSMLSELIMNWTIYSSKCTALLTLIIVISINMVVGFIPQVDSSAHLGGFISGFLLGFVLLMRPQLGWIDIKQIPPDYDLHLINIKQKYKAYQQLLWFLALCLLIVGFLSSLVKLMNRSEATQSMLT